MTKTKPSRVVKAPAAPAIAAPAAIEISPAMVLVMKQGALKQK